MICLIVKLCDDLPTAANDPRRRQCGDGLCMDHRGGCFARHPNRGAQTAVFELNIRISNPPYIDVCQSLASEAGLKSRNVEKRINAV
jgi:hypothetical protein